MAEPGKEVWIQWVTLTIAVLAVCTGISALRALSSSTKLQICTTRESNRWADYQAKSIKEYSYRLNRDILNSLKLLEVKNPKAQKFLAARIHEYDAEIGRYDKEKNQLRKEAEDLVKEQEVFKQKHGDFALAVMLLQLAILCSAVGALIKTKLMWFMGVIVGGWGAFYLVRGFLL